MNADPIYEAFALALHDSARAWRHALDQRLKPLGLSQAGWMSVALLARAAAPMTQRALAEALGVEPATVVSMVDRLQRLGLVRREMALEDRRIRQLFLTAEGERVYAEVRRIAADFRREQLAAIDPALLATSTETLQKLLRALHALPR